MMIRCILIVMSVLSFARVSAAQDTCTITFQTESDVPAYSAPYLDSALLLRMLPPGIPYEILLMGSGGIDTPYYQIRVDDQTTAWVDIRIISELSDACSFDYSLPEQFSPSDFLGVCELTADAPYPIYRASNLGELRRDQLSGEVAMIPPDYGRIVTARTAVSAHIYGGHAMEVGWVPLYQVDLGGCAPVSYDAGVRAAFVANTPLWTLPDALDGEPAGIVPMDARATVLAGPTPGRLTADVEGPWYLVQYTDAVIGWVWGGVVELDGDFPPEPIGTGVALAGARLWSVPDVKTGTVVASVGEGLEITVLAGPVEGPIRLDEDLSGDWYYVRHSGQAGWLWAGRLQLDAPTD